MCCLSACRTPLYRGPAVCRAGKSDRRVELPNAAEPGALRIPASRCGTGTHCSAARPSKLSGVKRGSFGVSFSRTGDLMTHPPIISPNLRIRHPDSFIRRRRVDR